MALFHITVRRLGFYGFLSLRSRSVERSTPWKSSGDRGDDVHYEVGVPFQIQTHGVAA